MALPNFEQLVRDVAREHSSLLTTNTNATCFKFIQLVLARLGPEWGHVGKTNGEGQFRMAQSFPRQCRDGIVREITGYSHDAIFCATPFVEDGFPYGVQVDLLGGGNDGPEPLGTPASPTWNVIPSMYYRVNNPWCPKLTGQSEPPKPQPTMPSVLPKGEAFATLKALDAFYRAPEGLQRPEGIGGDMEAIAQWFYQLVIERVPLDNVFAQIRNSEEWKQKHPW